MKNKLFYRDVISSNFHLFTNDNISDIIFRGLLSVFLIHHPDSNFTNCEGVPEMPTFTGKLNLARNLH